MTQLIMMFRLIVYKRKEILNIKRNYHKKKYVCARALVSTKMERNIIHIQRCRKTKNTFYWLVLIFDLILRKFYLKFLLPLLFFFCLSLLLSDEFQEVHTTPQDIGINYNLSSFEFSSNNNYNFIHIQMFNSQQLVGLFFLN